MTDTTLIIDPIADDAAHADAKAELWALCDHEPGSDQRIEIALYSGMFDGNSRSACCYGNAMPDIAFTADDKFDELRELISGMAVTVYEFAYTRTPLEQFVRTIHYGDTPQTNEEAATVVRWIAEWRESRTTTIEVQS